MKNKLRLRRKERTNQGITLIALIITIIVLLILAGVTITSLTGEKGIIKEANSAKELAEWASLEEQVEMAIITAEQKYKNPTLDQVIKEIINNKVITNKEQVQENGDIYSDLGYIITGKLDDYIGRVSIGENPPSEPEKSELEEAIENDITFNTKTEIEDSYGNKVVIPEGFKIAEDSATDVTGGIVIEDVNHTSTAGSQFVWIPVGEIKTENGTKTINLSRYTFGSDGTPTKQGENVIETNCQELATSSYGNTTAKDIEGFKTSATTNHGYYIGRYEARVGTERTSASQALGQVTVKPNDYIYNYVTQPQVATLARNMYTSSNFTSDLMNSYAWDTAIVFIQNFGQTNYSMQNSLNTTFASQGTNNLTDVTKQDKQLNIWDMASNDWEWTTETCTFSSPTLIYYLPCIFRGGLYSSSLSPTNYRDSSTVGQARVCDSFRIALYL